MCSRSWQARYVDEASCPEVRGRIQHVLWGAPNNHVHFAGVAMDVMQVAVEPDQALMEAGLDSLAAVELRNAVAARFGAAMPATLALDYPTLKV